LGCLNRAPPRGLLLFKRRLSLIRGFSPGCNLEVEIKFDTGGAIHGGSPGMNVSEG
jgi:hypothetical protein